METDLPAKPHPKGFLALARRDRARLSGATVAGSCFEEEGEEKGSA